MNRSYGIDHLLIEQFAAIEDQSIASQIYDYYKRQKIKLGTVIPIHYSRYTYYGNEFSELGNYKRALELYDLAISKNNYDLRAYCRKASALRELEEYSRAESVYPEALKVLEHSDHQIDAEQIEIFKTQIGLKLEKMKKEAVK